MYFNRYNMRSYRIVYVPCLTPGCNNTPLNIPMSCAAAQLEYNLQTNSKDVLELDCKRCGKKSVYNYASLLKVVPQNIKPIPLPKSYIWAILLVEIDTSDTMKERGFFGERLLVQLINNEGIDWCGGLRSESQFAPTLKPGEILAGGIFNKHYACMNLIKSGEAHELPIENIPEGSDFGIFFAPKVENTTHLQCANLFCRNPSCAHVFGLQYSQLKEHLDQGKAKSTFYDADSALMVLTCEICGVSMVADLASFNDLYKI